VEIVQENNDPQGHIIARFNDIQWLLLVAVVGSSGYMKLAWT
jgi:hypothetical protein